MFYLDKIPPTAANLNNSRVVKREKKPAPARAGEIRRLSAGVRG